MPKPKQSIMTVSKSPDSVAAVAASENSNANTEGPSSAADASALAAGGATTAAPSVATSSCPADVDAAALASSSTTTAAADVSSTAPNLKPPGGKSTAVINPYIRTKTNDNAVPRDAKAERRRRFIEKYRSQAPRRHHHGRAGPRDPGAGGSAGAVSPVSALDMLRQVRQWRNSWNGKSIGAYEGGHRILLNGMAPLRPRLFIFRRHVPLGKKGGEDRSLKQSETQQLHGPNVQEEEQQLDGVCELGTGITELAGEGGSGKTQICLSLCVTCALTPLTFPTAECARVTTQQGIHNSYYTSIYVIMGEGTSSEMIAGRLEKMVRARRRRNDPNETSAILSRIGLISIRNEEEFLDFVQNDLPNLLGNHNGHDMQRQHGKGSDQPTKIGLLAFDGIAGFFRFSDPLFQHSRRDSTFHRQRSSRLLRVSSQLRRLSDVYDVPVLITNQVTACIPPAIGSTDMSTTIPSSAERVAPALGLVWSNCVSTRILLQRKDGMTITLPDESDLAGSANREARPKNVRVVRARKARILQSVNVLGDKEIWYAIDTGDVTALA